MKIGFVKQSWHDPRQVVPTTVYWIYDEENHAGTPRNPSPLQTPDFNYACCIVNGLGLEGTRDHHIKPEHVKIVIAALRFAGIELGKCPK